MNCTFTIHLESFIGVNTKVWSEVNISENMFKLNEEAQGKTMTFINGSTSVHEYISITV